MTEETLKKLTAAFQRELTDEQACAYAGITLKELSAYEKKHPDFVKSKSTMATTMTQLAQNTIATALQTNPNFALKFVTQKKTKPKGYIGFGYL